METQLERLGSFGTSEYLHIQRKRRLPALSRAATRAKPATPEKTTKKVRRMARVLPEGEPTGPCHPAGVRTRRRPWSGAGLRMNMSPHGPAGSNTPSVSQLRCAELEPDNEPRSTAASKGNVKLAG